MINYGITVADIGDVRVTPGVTYYYCWFNPQYPDFITYWGPTSGQGTTSEISPAVAGHLASNEFAGIVQGYNL